MRRPRSFGRRTIVPFLMLVGGCRGDEAMELAAPAPDWTVGATPAVSIGGDDPRPEYALHQVEGVTRLSDGRIVVANAGTSELRFYSPSGAYLSSAVGEGDGPGELRFIVRLARSTGDTLTVYSRDPGLTWFDADGTYVRSERRDMFGTPNHPCRFGEGWSWSLLSDGRLLRLLVDNFAPRHCPDSPEGPWRQTGLLGIPSPDASTFDTIALLPATERLGSGYRVFGDDLLFGFSNDRVYAGDTGSDEILVLAYDGDTLTSFPAPFERKRVPEELKVEGVIEVALPDGSTRFVPGYKNYPETFPRYGRLQVDAEGYLWVMEYPVEREPFNSWRLALPQGNLVPDGGARWRVLDEEGLVVQEVRTPPGLFVTEIGRDYVLGISRDDLDVETVHLYDLRR